MDIPRILISGTSSRAGKTVISIGLMRALRNRGYKVQPFKVGPDFIDPSYHLFATGRVSRNLDGYMMRDEDILETFVRNSKGADIAVIEGTMGLYDSHNAVDAKGSTAEVSKVIKAPVILVANVERISRTAAPFVLGYKLFDPSVDIAGVVLNRVGNPRHAYKAKTAVEVLAKMRVFGTVPRSQSIEIPERHLGLIPAYEKDKLEQLFDNLASIVEEHIDIDGILEVASNAPEIEEVPLNPLFSEPGEPKVTLGVARDVAFTFYYQDNLDAFAAQGARLVPIDTLHDSALPKDLDALYIGGGFPEIMAEQLERNQRLRQSIYDFCASGKPCYAECGGLMYLGQSINTRDNHEYEMVGFLPIATKMEAKFQALGYVKNLAVRDNPISRSGDLLVGHEFHYSKVKAFEKLTFAYRVERGKGVDGTHDGIIKGNTLANYMHVHVLSYPSMVNNFLRVAEKFKN
jgi:cobyrinic acid a,c-diamide synthase